MNGLAKALWTESLKVRRSKMLWVTLLLFAFVAFMMGLLMLIAIHPEYAGRSAIFSAKASIIKGTGWPDFFALLIQIVLSLGTIGFGVVTSWVFGREYSDRTLNDLLALPVSRLSIVTAKFIIIFAWCIILALTIFFTGLFMGFAVKIHGGSVHMILHYFKIFMISGTLTILYTTPVAFIACYGRGFLLGIGYAILTIIVTQFIFAGVPGITPYFPYAIPALYSGLAGPGFATPGFTGYLVLFFTSSAGFLGTAAWWQFADHQ